LTLSNTSSFLTWSIYSSLQQLNFPSLDLHSLYVQSYDRLRFSSKASSP
jgi:hypothetical protein